MTAKDNPYSPLDPEVVSTWLAYSDVSQHTRDAYSYALRYWCRFVASCGYDFDSLDESHVLEFKAHLVEERRLSPSSVSLYLSGLRSFYRFAASRGLEDIAKDVKGVKVASDFKRDALSPSQARELLASFDGVDDEKGLRDRAVVSLMLHTSMRDIEIVRANVGDLASSGGHPVLKVWGKGRSSADDFVVLTPSVRGHIDDYLRLRAAFEDSAPLFASVAHRNAGKRLTTRSVSRIVKDSLRRIGLDNPRLTAHSLRHTAVTLALLGGASVEEAQAMARHADISTTMIYSHHVDRVSNAAEKAVANLLDG